MFRHELATDPASSDAVVVVATAQKHSALFGWWYDNESSSSDSKCSNKKKYYHSPNKGGGGGGGGGVSSSTTNRWAFLQFLALCSMLLLFFLLFALQRSLLLQTTQQQSLDNSHSSTSSTNDSAESNVLVCHDAVQRLIDGAFRRVFESMILIVCAHLWILIHIFERISLPPLLGLAAKVRLVALDFDFTIVNVHTGGNWKKSAVDLTQHVRPDFVAFIKGCLHRGLFVSVATFSTQKTLIGEVLNHALGVEQAATIPIWGGDDELKHYAQGKQSQLHLAIEYFNRRSTNKNAASTLQPSNAVLVDDDLDNIAIAHRDGYHTMPYIPGRSICLTKLS